MNEGLITRGGVDITKHASFIMQDGTVEGDIKLFGHANAEISGGIFGDLHIVNYSHATLHGSFNFAYGDYFKAPQHSNYTTYNISGNLLNGDPINSRILVNEGCTLTLIPEPMTIAILGLGGIWIRRGKHNKQTTRSQN